MGVRVGDEKGGGSRGRRREGGEEVGGRWQEDSKNGVFKK